MKIKHTHKTPPKNVRSFVLKTKQQQKKKHVATVPPLHVDNPFHCAAFARSRICSRASSPSVIKFSSLIYCPAHCFYDALRSVALNRDDTESPSSFSSRTFPLLSSRSRLIISRPFFVFSTTADDGNGSGTNSSKTKGRKMCAGLTLFSQMVFRARVLF